VSEFSDKSLVKNARSFLIDCNTTIEDKSPSDIILSALVLLGDYNNWCQGAQAVTAAGRKTRPGSPDAVAWSIEGAVGKVSNPAGIVPPTLIYLLDTLVQEDTGSDLGVGWFNDTYDHGTVIDFLEEAYRRLE
jgi:hypothetical protein